MLVKVVNFHHQISRLPISAISMGVFMHPEMRKNAKYPLDTVSLESILSKNIILILLCIYLPKVCV